MKQPHWINRRALLHLHSASLATFGGSPGIRDEALLDSALAPPQNRFLYAPESDLSELAAAYGFGIAKNHPFIDGNKRAAFHSVGLFLAINGSELVADQVDAIQTMLSLAASELSEEEFAAWGRKNTKRRE
ncbi:MAG TPA: type II toxin-antitoxin system death-on-curing family toxin [Candidatus Acidoferrales bacterium]|jgi:death-on-curing protein|nr:type II toxin-antitoxin system death-on-curing family toxin [Candidatus Acidoferrales bacterium]